MADGIIEGSKPKAIGVYAEADEQRDENVDDVEAEYLREQEAMEK